MRKFIIIIAFAVGLSGCANVSNLYGELSGSSVSPAAVYVAANAFDAVEATATNYLRLKKCTGSNGPACRSPAVTQQIIPAVRAGRVARTNLENFMQTNPGALGPAGLYNALVASTNTLQSIISQYSIKS